MFKIQKDNIIFSYPVSPVLQADSLKLSSWGSPLKEKEEKTCLIKVGTPLGDLLMKDRHVLDCLLGKGFYIFTLKKIVVKYI